MTTKRINQEILEKSPAYIQSAIHLGTALLPTSIRETWRALWSLQKTIEQVYFQAADPSVKAQKSLWWIQELDRLKQGNSRHPLTQVLQKHYRNDDSDMHKLQKCLDNWINLLAQPHDAWLNQAELSRFLHQMRGEPEILLSELTLSKSSKHQLNEFTQASSEARFRIELLRDFGALIRKEISPLPLSELHSHQLVTEQILHLRIETELNQWLSIASAQAEMARQKAQKAKQWLEHLPPMEQKSQWLALALLNIELKMLNQIEKNNYTVISQRIELSPRTSVWEILKSRFLG